MTHQSFTEALRNAGAAYARAIAMPYAIASAMAEAEAWECEVQSISRAAHELGMPSYLVDLTTSRGRHRSQTTGARPLSALLTEWRHTLSWWWAGCREAEAEATREDP